MAREINLGDVNNSLMLQGRHLSEIEKDTNLFGGIGKLLLAGQITDYFQNQNQAKLLKDAKTATKEQTEALKKRTKAADDQTEAFELLNQQMTKFVGFFDKFTRVTEKSESNIVVLASELRILNKYLVDNVRKQSNQFGDTAESIYESRRGPDLFTPRYNVSGSMTMGDDEDDIRPEGFRFGDGISTTEVVAAGTAIAFRKQIKNATYGMAKLALRMTGLELVFDAGKKGWTILGESVKKLTTTVDDVDGRIKKLPTVIPDKPPAKAPPKMLRGSSATGGIVDLFEGDGYTVLPDDTPRNRSPQFDPKKTGRVSDMLKKLGFGFKTAFTVAGGGLVLFDAFQAGKLGLELRALEKEKGSPLTEEEYIAYMKATRGFMTVDEMTSSKAVPSDIAGKGDYKFTRFFNNLFSGSKEYTPDITGAPSYEMFSGLSAADTFKNSPLFDLKKNQDMLAENQDILTNLIDEQTRSKDLFGGMNFNPYTYRGGDNYSSVQQNFNSGGIKTGDPFADANQ